MHRKEKSGGLVRTCKEVVKIISSGEKLSFFGRAELFLHLLICKHCSRYKKQMQILRKTFRKFFAGLTNISSDVSSKLKEDIKSKLFEE
jgi:hypothetical protein